MRRRSRVTPAVVAPAGILAQFDGTCPRCDEAYFRLRSQIVPGSGGWIHVHCASGWDDE